MKSNLDKLARRVRSGLALLPALVLVLVLAADAGAQASRSRSGGGSDSQSGGTVSRPAGSSGSGSSAASRPPASPRSGGTVTRTRPAEPPEGPVVVEKDRRPPVRGRGGPYYGGYYPWGDPWWSPYYGYSWWRYGWHGGYGYPMPVRPYSSRVSQDMGALDMDLKPGDTQIWIDGEYVGIADRYDGWPQYLWLREGSYHFVFYQDGYRTISREYTVRPGLVIDIEDALERGESTAPEDLFPPRPTPNRDARLRRYEEQREAARQSGDDWRERSQVREHAPDADLGSLRLRVEPREAAVYLDGRLVGTGDDLARLRRGLAVNAGVHRVQVVHPDFPEGYDAEIEVEPGEDLEVEVVLGD
ncbi:MAG TPA: hypothetical protein VHQ65_08035 [Thermoanaerobaculia bacterium]|nr:hypothetical protein [Thermoanaerobaculia bacterium]